MFKFCAPLGGGSKERGREFFWIGWLVGSMVGWLVGWLLGCLVAWLLGCLVAWLTPGHSLQSFYPSLITPPFPYPKKKGTSGFEPATSRAKFPALPPSQTAITKTHERRMKKKSRIPAKNGLTNQRFPLKDPNTAKN